MLRTILSLPFEECKLLNESMKLTLAFVVAIVGGKQ